MIPWNLIIVIVATLLGFAGGLWTAMMFAVMAQEFVTGKAE